MACWIDPVGATMSWVATQGLLALVGLIFVERVVPILPSNFLWVAIGVACAQMRWTFFEATTASVAGSLTAWMFVCLCGAGIERNRARSLLLRLRTWFDSPTEQAERQIATTLAREAGFAFGSQLVPMVRLVAPMLAGLVRMGPVAFAVGCAAGAAIWNALFIGAGYAAARTTGVGNVSAVALGTHLLLHISEILLCRIASRVDPPLPPAV
jgi:membrane protein DedA with SNARE-associated domain